MKDCIECTQQGQLLVNNSVYCRKFKTAVARSCNCDSFERKLEFTKDEMDVLEGLKYSLEEDLSDDLYEYEQIEERDLTKKEIIKLWQKDLDIYESLFAKLGLETDRAKIEKEGYNYLKSFREEENAEKH